MATLTVRISDEVRDALQAKAAEGHRSLSDFVRDQLEAAVAERPERGGRGHLDLGSLSTLDRHKLSLLHRILARVLPEDANGIDGDAQYQLRQADVLEHGFTEEYWTETAHLSPELSPQHCTFVVDVLQMFTIATDSLNRHIADGAPVDEDLQEDLTFQGFDHNDTLELQMSEYVRYLVNDHTWPEFQAFVHGPGRGNSHTRTRQTYSRMLSAFRESQQRRIDRGGFMLLTMEELQQIAAARTHPGRARHAALSDPDRTLTP